MPPRATKKPAAPMRVQAIDSLLYQPKDGQPAAPVIVELTPHTKKTAAGPKARSSSLPVLRAPSNIEPDPARPTWDLTTPLEAVFAQPPKGWAEAFTDAKDETEHILSLVKQIRDKKKTAAILPSPGAVLAPFWLVPEPRHVRAIVFFDNPVGGYAGDEAAPPPVPKGRRTAAPVALRRSRSQGLGPEGPTRDLLDRLAARARAVLEENPEEDLSASFTPKEGESTVQRWSRQGVLVLTVNMLISSLDDRGKNSYDHLWLGFYQSIVDAIRMVNKHVPTLLLGGHDAMNMELDSGNILFSPSLDDALADPTKEGKIVQMLTRLNGVFEERSEPPIYW